MKEELVLKGSGVEVKGEAVGGESHFSREQREVECPQVVMSRKRRGEMAEAAFTAKAAGLGFCVSKPWGESSRYDLVVDNGKRLLRVQVKSVHRPGKEAEYRVYARGCSMKVYDASEIDLLAAYVVPADAWYLFPVEEFLKYKSMRLYPVMWRKVSKFEAFREAWWLLR